MKSVAILAILVISCYTLCPACMKENDACLKEEGNKCVQNFLDCPKIPEKEKREDCFASLKTSMELYGCQYDNQCPHAVDPPKIPQKQIFNQKKAHHKAHKAHKSNEKK